MKIQPASAALIAKTFKDLIPNHLKTELLNTPKSLNGMPGLILHAPNLLRQEPELSKTIGGLSAQYRISRSPCIVIPAHELRSSAIRGESVELLRQISSLVAAQVNPYAKAAVDGVWLAFGVKGLIEEWQRPDADRAACILKLTKIGVSAFGVAASLDTTLTKFDPWKNGVNFLVTAGDMIHEDKLSDWTRLVPTNDEHLELMNQLIKVAGVAIDPIATEQKSFRPSIPVGKVELITSARKRL